MVIRDSEVGLKTEAFETLDGSSSLLISVELLLNYGSRFNQGIAAFALWNFKSYFILLDRSQCPI